MLISALALAGCVPHPGFRQAAPLIAGTLEVAGLPLKGVRIRQCLAAGAAGACEQYSETVTDSQGRFTLEGARTFKFFETLLGDAMALYGVEVLTDQGVLRWSHGGTGQTMPAEVRLGCALDGGELACTPLP